MAPELVTQERRTQCFNLRVPFPVEVRCMSDAPGGTRRYLALNLGRGGLFLKTLLPLETGTLLGCAFHLPGDPTPLQVTAKVAWVREASPADESPPGMGLRFLDLDPEDRARIQATLAG